MWILPPSFIVLLTGAHLQSWDWHQFVQQRGGGGLSHGTNITRLAPPRMNGGSFPWNSVHASWQLPQSLSLFLLFVPSLRILALVCAPLFVSSAFSKKGKWGDETTEVVKLRVSPYMSCDIVYFKEVDVSGLCCDELPACVWLSRVHPLEDGYQRLGGHVLYAHFNFIKS